MANTFFNKRNIILANTAAILPLILVLLDYTKGNADGHLAGINVLFFTKILLWIAVLVNIVALFRLKKPWLQNSLLVLIMSSLTLFVVNWFCGKLLAFRNSQKPAVAIEFPKYPFMKDSVLGYMLPPDSSFLFEKKVNGKPLYSVNFSSDANGWRITPATKAEIKYKYALFFGCSFTWGEGLQNNQTSAYYFEEKNPNYQAYNLGYSGYGPHHMLARLNTSKLPSKISQKNGFAIYTYIPDHINRATPCSNSYFGHEGNGPLYEYQNGNLQRRGMFKDISGYRKWLYRFVKNNNIFQYFNIGWPIYHSHDQYIYIADMLAQAAQEYEAQFGNKNFYVVFYPAKEDYKPIQEHLRKLGVKYLDYSNLFDPTLPTYAIAHDGHPTAAANQALVNKLQHDLNLPQMQ
jgi:hypothetical protein